MFLIGWPADYLYGVAWYHDRRMPAPASTMPAQSSPYVSHRMEIRKMNRKWLVFPLSAGMLVLIVVAASLSRADDEETPLGKIMEKVNKHNSIIQRERATR